MPLAPRLLRMKQPSKVSNHLALRRLARRLQARDPTIGESILVRSVDRHVAEKNESIIAFSATDFPR